MKRNFFKKAVGFISIFAVALSFFAFPTVYAQDIYSDDETVEFNTLDEYIEYSIPRHLYSHSLVVNGTLSYSKPVMLYNFENNSVIGSEIFIFEDNELLGKTEVYETEDGYVSAFDTYITDDLFSAYQSGEEIAMGYINSNLFMYNDSNGYVYIEGFGKYDLPLETPQILNTITVWSNTSPDLGVPYATLASVKLDVRHIDNSTTYNSNGSCWAACVAMKLNYQMKWNLDADTVFEAADDWKLTLWEFGSTDLSVTLENEGEVFRKYGYNVNETATHMTHSEIYNILKNNKPLAISMNMNNSANGHQIIIKGLTLESASSTYFVDDPNYLEEKSFVLNGNPSQTYPSFYYQYSGGYDNWRYTFY